MSQPALSRELALRIGLAAKVLPDTRSGYLLELLVEYCGLPLTAKKLASVTIDQYQQLLTGCYTRKDISHSLDLLHGQQSPFTNTAKIKYYRPGDMPNSIRVAVASGSGEMVDAGFSDCEKFYIYQLSADEARLIAIRMAETEQSLKSEQKQFYRAEIIEDCQVLYIDAIGGRAAAKLVNKEVHPIKVPKTVAVGDILEQLQYVLSTSPPPWLAKSMGVEPGSYLFSGEKIS
jgi:nitrogen fixation protein NifX